MTKLRTQRGFTVGGRRSLFLSTATAVVLCATLGAQAAKAQSAVATGDVNPSTAPTPSWTVGGDLRVGEAGVGALDIEDGGVVTNDTAFVGDQTGGQGTVTVSGQGAGGASTWTNNGDVVIGQAGSGVLILEDGGIVTNADGYLAGSLGGQGAVTVTGRGADGVASTWANSGSLYVGAEDQGELTIQNGGSVSSTFGVIGGGAAGHSTVIVSGRDATGASQWTNSSTVYVGYAGTGSLRVEGGALVNSGQGVIGGNVSGPGVGTGDVVVTGDDGLGNASTWNSENLYVGAYSTGTLTIENGGAVNTTGAGYIGYQGAGAGMVTVSSSTPNTSVWAVTAEINVGEDQTGSLTIDKGGAVSAGASVIVARNAGSAGTLHLLGDASGRGVLETDAVIKGLGAAALDLDGGVLRATGDVSDFLSGFNLLTAGAEGVWFDTNGHDIRVATGFSGSSSIDKLGLGRLTLSGDSSTFSGVTNVAAGVLLVGEVGDAAALGGDVEVQAGAALGGTGTIGGNVNVAGAAALSPGGSVDPGTLTIDGNLTLATAAVLNYRLGQADTPGGVLNDLIVVHGDLALNGTLNVTQTNGGAFGPGVYRLIDYDGALSGGGLTLGSLPSGGPDVVQTSIANQVNLVRAAPGGPPSPPPPVNFWDGDAGVADDGVVTGGDGVWRGGPGSAWTQADGAVNGAFANGIFAVFAAAPGTVTVDNAPGAVSVSGVQFASDGYRIEGGAVGLDSDDAIVRVGDGTSAGTAFNAIVASELTGPGHLLKTDLGTLILTGRNTYSGGTTVAGGALQLGDGGTSGSIQGDVAVEGVLAFNRSDAATFDGAISGGGLVRQVGGGTTILTADSSAFAGQTELRSGALQVDGVLGGAIEIFSGGRLTGGGQVGATINSGVIAPGRGGFGTLTIAGDYAGAGGALEIETQLGGDASPTDRLVVAGSTSGDTSVTILNRAGLGAQTRDGIQVVQVNGASNGRFTLANGDYALAGRQVLVAGAYGYVLQKDQADNGWRLRSSAPTADGAFTSEMPLYQPGAPLYEAYADSILSLSGVSTLRQRVGDRRYDSGDAGRNGVWARVEGKTTHLEPQTSTTGARQEGDSWKVQFGVDRVLSGAEDGARVVGGLTAHIGGVETRATSVHGDGDIDTQARGVGATLTWYGGQGAYLDAQAQASWFDSDLRSNLAGPVAEGRNGRGYGLSLEAGKAFAVQETFSLTPQAQLSYAATDFSGFADRFGARVESDEGQSLQGRLGLAFDHARDSRDAAGQASRISVYGLIDLKYEFLDGARVLVSGAPLETHRGRTWAGVGLGGAYTWRDGRYVVFGEAGADTSLKGFGDSYTASATAGVRMRF